jgi:hypothetical protein
MSRAIIEAIYLRIALAMPLWWQWQWTFVMSARFYFENHKEDDFVGCPWSYRLKRFDT